MSSVLGLGGSPRQEKPAKSPLKGVQKCCQSGDRWVLSKGGNEHMRTLNNTEGGGGGGRARICDSQTVQLWGKLRAI